MIVVAFAAMELLSYVVLSVRSKAVATRGRRRQDPVEAVVGNCFDGGACHAELARLAGRANFVLIMVDCTYRDGAGIIVADGTKLAG